MIGPTAAKKTELAFEIQSKIPGVVINSDSMQVYSELRSLTNMPQKVKLLSTPVTSLNLSIIQQSMLGIGLRMLN